MSKPTETLVQIGELSRRDAIKSIALAVTVVAGGQMTLEAAQHVHSQVKAIQ